MGVSYTWESWNASEDRLVRKIWATDRTIKEMAHLIPRHTPYAIGKRMLALKLGRRPTAVRSKSAPVWETVKAFLLANGPHNRRGIAKATGFSEAAVRNALNAAKKREEVYVASRIRLRAGGYADPVFYPGKGIDAPPLPRMTKAERAASARARQPIRNVKKLHPVMPGNPMSFVVRQAALASLGASA